MTDEKKKEFTLRITEANPTQMIVILYDICLEYIEEATLSEDEVDFQFALNNAKNCIAELKKSVKLNSDLGANYYSLYTYFYKQVSKAIAGNKKDYLVSIENQIKAMRQTWTEIAKKDDREPVMANSEKLFAGYTYNKNSINENPSAFNNRGFLV